MVIDGNVENIGRQIYPLRVGIFRLLCLEQVYKGEAGKEDREVNTINDKTIISHDKKNLLKMKNGFNSSIDIQNGFINKTIFHNECLCKF